MTKEQLDAVLADHKRWFFNDGGKRADLIGADLSNANLSGAILNSANLARADLISADLSGANLIRANLSGANLTSVNLARADLIRADLSGANLSGAILTRANLYCANLSGAILTRADLNGAYLSDTNLSGAQIENRTIISLLRRATRSDGYGFFLWHCQDGFFIQAGCRFMSLTEARSHWRKTRGGTPLGAETMDILAFFAAAIRRNAKETITAVMEAHNEG